MGRGKKWSISEIDYLHENWGRITLNNLSMRLKRTKVAIDIKAKRMNLGASTRADEYMTANQVAILLNIDSHVVLRWIEKHNLKAVKKVMLFKRKFWLVKHYDLCRWLKNNQDRFDSRRIELFALGYEPEWLQEKRRRDRELPKNRFKKWNNLEIQRILHLSQDMTYKEIAKEMDRSHDSIERKFSRLKYQSEVLF